MFPDDYKAYEVIEESEGMAVLKSTVGATRCHCCDVGKVESKGAARPITVSDIDSRTGEIIELQIIHRRYKCNNPECQKTFTVDVLPSKCFPNRNAQETPKKTNGRETKTVSVDILQTAMDTMLNDVDSSGNPYTITAVAEKYGLDERVVSAELNRRVTQAIDDHIASLAACEELALVPFEYRKQECCIIIGYLWDNDEGLKPVLYDIRDKYNVADLQAFMKMHRFQGVKVPIYTFTKMDSSFVDMVESIYKNEYQVSDRAYRTGILRDSAKTEIVNFEPIRELDFRDQIYLKVVRRRLELAIDLKELDDDDNITDIDPEDDICFEEMLSDWWASINHHDIMWAIKPLHKELEIHTEGIDLAMQLFRDDQLYPEKDFPFVQYFHQRNVRFEEMRYRVLCMARNKQNVSFQSLVAGTYVPPRAGQTIQNHYVDLNMLNQMYAE